MTLVGRALIASRKLGEFDLPQATFGSQPTDAEASPLAHFPAAALSEEESAEESFAAEDATRPSAVPLSQGDPDWHWRTSNRRRQVRTGSKSTPSEWLSELRALRQEKERVLVVLHLFAGHRRPRDIESFLNKLGRALRVSHACHIGGPGDLSRL